ncbi:hypothetical protein M413DRAFT_203621 [Hebeloma cylindrosporum]|uniref:Uncharacterized protein n=1 Tax=Hebeloma cylindrosporum TaxID=76867 RepID=A0A0C3CFP3_HEBCY|nr:hypothetical protein M413DRAFT_203621 [Hebeloma cylindrosporum h7]
MPRDRSEFLCQSNWQLHRGLFSNTQLVSCFTIAISQHHTYSLWIDTALLLEGEGIS